MRPPSSRALTVLLGVAIAVSIVHYVDNYAAYEHYPAGGPIPDPPRTVIGLAWFVFTAFGIAGWAFYRRGEIRRAALALAVYSGSGLVGSGHYTVPGAADMPWWRHAHIVADIACGIAVLAFAVIALRRVSGAAPMLRSSPR